MFTNCEYPVWHRSYSEKERDRFQRKWLRFMRKHNCWYGFFKWMNDQDSLTPQNPLPDFNDKVLSMYQKYKKKRKEVRPEDGYLCDPDAFTPSTDLSLVCPEPPSVLDSAPKIKISKMPTDEELRQCELVEVDELPYTNASYIYHSAPSNLLSLSMELPSPIEPLPSIPLSSDSAPEIPMPLLEDAPLEDCIKTLAIREPEQVLWQESNEENSCIDPFTCLDPNCQISFQRSQRLMSISYQKSRVMNDSRYITPTIWPDYLSPREFADRQELLNFTSHILDSTIVTSKPQEFTMESLPFHPGIHTLITDIDNNQDTKEWHTLPDEAGKVSIIKTLGELPPQARLLEESGPGI